MYAICAEWCHDLAYQRGHNDVCRGRPEHSSLMREHCLRCSTPPPIYHGKRSNVIVTQCVRVRACMQKPTTWRRRDWVVLVCPDLPTNMSPRDKMSSHCGVVGITTSPTTESRVQFPWIKSPDFITKPTARCTHSNGCTCAGKCQWDSTTTTDTTQ